MVKLVEWDGRQVVGGIVFHWADGHQDKYEYNFLNCRSLKRILSRFGVGENEMEGLRLMEVPEGSHIAFVLGRSGW